MIQPADHFEGYQARHSLDVRVFGGGTDGGVLFADYRGKREGNLWLRAKLLTAIPAARKDILLHPSIGNAKNIMMLSM